MGLDLRRRQLRERCGCCRGWRSNNKIIAKNDCTEFEPSETEGHSVLGIRAQQCDYNNATDHHLPTNRCCRLDSDSVDSYNH